MIKNFGYFLGQGIIFVFYFFLSVYLIRGIDTIIKFFHDARNVVFHHHYHYKDRR